MLLVMLRDVIQLHALGSQEENVKKYYHYHFIANCLSMYIETAPVDNMTALNGINTEETLHRVRRRSMLYVFSCAPVSCVTLYATFSRFSWLSVLH